MQVLSRPRGFTLIEVMMAVLIFSIGLIGLASLMVMATRSNHAAYLRTQVIFLANNMANRMSANPAGVWNGSYNSTAYPVAAASAGCGSGAACGSTALATHDQQMWSSQLRIFLPHPNASISCSGVGAVGYNPTSQINYRPPYGGTCTMIVKWAEMSTSNQTTQTSGAITQNFIWSFQP